MPSSAWSDRKTQPTEQQQTENVESAFMESGFNSKDVPFLEHFFIAHWKEVST